MSTEAMTEAFEIVAELERKTADMDAFWARTQALTDAELRATIEQSRAFRDQLEPWRVAIAYGALAMREEANA